MSFFRYVARQKRLAMGIPRRTIVPEGEGQPSARSRLPAVNVSADSVFLCRRVYDIKLKRILRNPCIGSAVWFEFGETQRVRDGLVLSLHSVACHVHCFSSLAVCSLCHLPCLYFIRNWATLVVTCAHSRLYWKSCYYCLRKLAVFICFVWHFFVWLLSRWHVFALFVRAACVYFSQDCFDCVPIGRLLVFCNWIGRCRCYIFSD